MLIQLWVSGTKEEVMGKEIEIRKNIYKYPKKMSVTIQNIGKFRAKL